MSSGYDGETDHNGADFETLTWAAGILACPGLEPGAGMTI
jgi:hypothetical protein